MALFSEIPTVFSASRFEQKETEAPASVSIITAYDIKMYGYRTLADIIRSVRGFYVRYDRNYAYLGLRGFGRVGDYNSRVLLLVDGHRINDAIYGTAPIGTEFPLDVDLIERVEFIRGPSSSLYGANAFLGIINVITRRGKEVKGAEVSAETGRYDTYKGRATYGDRLSNGTEFLVSGSYYSSGGPNPYFKEFDSPETNNGIAKNLDWDEYRSFYSKLAFRDFSMDGGYHYRDKGVPTAAFSTIFNDSRFRTVDERAFWDLNYDHMFENQLNVSGRLSYNHYRYNGDYPYAPIDSESSSASILNRDSADSETLGAEFQATKRIFEKHLVVAGFEYRNDFSASQRNYDQDPYRKYLDQTTNLANYGIYVQDEFRMTDKLILTAGIRHDEYTTFGGTTNPRLGLIYHPFEKTVFKLLYGTAFRPPSAYELYYSDGTTVAGNPNLKPEKISTYELVWEQYLGKYLHFSAAAFYNDMTDLITYEPDPATGLNTYRNVDNVFAKGLEFELQGHFPRDIEGRISYVIQKAEDVKNGALLPNTPEHQAKLNLILPIIRKRLFLGTELLYMSSRKTLSGGNTDDAFVTNLTLYAPNVINKLNLSVSVYNIFNQKYEDPGSYEHIQDVLRQDGISFRLKATYSF